MKRLGNAMGSLDFVQSKISVITRKSVRIRLFASIILFNIFYITSSKSSQNNESAMSANKFPMNIIGNISMINATKDSAPHSAIKIKLADVCSICWCGKSDSLDCRRPDRFNYIPSLAPNKSKQITEM